MANLCVNFNIISVSPFRETRNEIVTQHDHFKIKLRYVNPEIAFQSLFAFTHKWQESEIPLRELFTYLK